MAVARVDLFIDGVFLASDLTAPYQFSWDTTSVPNGAHQIKAIAYDGGALASVPSTINVTVQQATPDTTLPTTSITSPSNNDTVLLGTTTISATADDNVGVTKVDFYVDNALIGTDTSLPYQMVWNNSLGTHTLLSKAYDAANNVGVSSAVSVRVVESTAPIVNIKQPKAGRMVRGNTTISASATDNTKVASMRILINGNLVASAVGSSIKYNWNSRALPIGNYTITVTAADVYNNIGSKSVIVTLQ